MSTTAIEDLRDNVMTTVRGVLEDTYRPSYRITESLRLLHDLEVTRDQAFDLEDAVTTIDGIDDKSTQAGDLLEPGEVLRVPASQYLATVRQGALDLITCTIEDARSRA